VILGNFQHIPAKSCWLQGFAIIWCMGFAVLKSTISFSSHLFDFCHIWQHRKSNGINIAENSRQ